MIAAAEEAQGVDMIDNAAKDLTQDLTIEAQRDIDRALVSREKIAREENEKLERRIRMAMAAKETSDGRCFYCERTLDVERDAEGREVKLHPMPYLECKGPPITDARVGKNGRIERSVVRHIPRERLPELKRVVRPFGDRD